MIHFLLPSSVFTVFMMNKRYSLLILGFLGGFLELFINELHNLSVYFILEFFVFCVFDNAKEKISTSS